MAKQVIVVMNQLPFCDLNYNDHSNHNPECDIIEGHLDGDSYMTYGVYVNGPKKGKEFMEYYRGENYKVGSKKRSYSRMWNDPTKIPVKYFTRWQKLRQIYETIKN